MNDLVIMERQNIVDIADAIRTKTGVNDEMTLGQISEQINEMSSIPEAINTALEQAKASGEFDGKDGDDGYTPVKGVDYWTEEDQTTIVNDVLEQIPKAGVTSVNGMKGDVVLEMAGGNLQKKYVIPNEYDQVIVPDDGYSGLSSVTVTKAPYGWVRSSSAASGWIADIIKGSAVAKMKQQINLAATATAVGILK